MKEERPRQGHSRQGLRLIILAIVMTLLMGQPVAWGRDPQKTEITIHRYDHLSLSGQDGGVGKQSGVAFKIWRLPEKYKDYPSTSHAINSNRYSDLLEDLESLSEKDLDALALDWVASDKTDDKGDVTIALEDGAYYVREIPQNPPLKYMAAPFLFTLPLKEGKTLYPKIRIDKPTSPDGRVVVKKTDSVTGHFLKGAGFELRSVGEKGSLVPIKTTGRGTYLYDAGRVGQALESNLEGQALIYTDEAGKIDISSLPEGDYVLIEKEVPKGYTASKKVHPFTIHPGQVSELTIKNRPGGGYHFFKYDKKSKKGLGGARFRVLRANDRKDRWLNPDGSPAGGKDDRHALYISSDEAGQLEVGGLPFDKQGTTYYLYEVQAPSGYELPKDSVTPFLVTADSYKESVGKEIDIANQPLTPTPPPGPGPKNPPVPSKPPRTGDSSMMTYVMIGLAAAAALTLILVLKKQNKDKDT